MSGGVEGEVDVAESDRIAILKTVYGIASRAVGEDGRAVGGAEVLAGAWAGVVGMGVGDDRAFDGGPRVDMEAARRAIEAAIGEN